MEHTRSEGKVSFVRQESIASSAFSSEEPLPYRSEASNPSTPDLTVVEEGALLRQDSGEGALLRQESRQSRLVSRSSSRLLTSIDAAWDDMKRYANGCSEDYFLHQSGSIRVDFNSSKKVIETDPISVMKEGVMVLYYDQTDGAFERKLLKVDEQLRFIYLLDGQSKVGPATRGNEKANLVAIPLAQVRHIYTMDDAVHICEENAIVSDSILHENTFVMWVEPASEKEMAMPIKDLDEDMPPAERLYVFVAAPQQQLRSCIMACKEFTQGNGAGGSSKSRLRVDQVALQDIDELMAADAEDFKFDASFRGQTALRTITVFTDTCDKPNMGGLKERLVAELLPMDMTRVHYVLQDAISLRRASQAMAGSGMFKRGITRFITDWEKIRLPMEETVIAGAVEESLVVHRMLLVNSHDSPECHYVEASARAVVASLRHLFQLEKDFQMLTQQEARAGDDDDEDDQDQDEVNKAVLAKLTGKTPVKLSDSRWQCKNCRYINSAPLTRCEVCDDPVDADSLAGPTAGAVLGAADTKLAIIKDTPTEPVEGGMGISKSGAPAPPAPPAPAAAAIAAAPYSSPRKQLLATSPGGTVASLMSASPGRGLLGTSSGETAPPFPAGPGRRQPDTTEAVAPPSGLGHMQKTDGSTDQQLRESLKEKSGWTKDPDAPGSARTGGQRKEKCNQQ